MYGSKMYEPVKLVILLSPNQDGNGKQDILVQRKYKTCKNGKLTTFWSESKRKDVYFDTLEKCLLLGCYVLRIL